MMMEYFREFHPDDQVKFEELYQKSPHLYKRHLEKFEQNYNSNYTDVANNFTPDDLNQWVSKLPKLTKYERSMYAKIDKHNDLIIISYYYFSTNNIPYLSRRCIADFYDNGRIRDFYSFTKKALGNTTPAVMLHCDGIYQLGGYTDYDRFYTHYQRKLDDKSYEILSQINEFKYLPFKKLKFINPYLIIDNHDNKELLYQIEIIIKMNNIRLATSLHLRREIIQMSDFKLLRKEIMSGMTYEQYKHKLEQFSMQRAIAKRKEIDKQIIAKNKFYELDDFIIRTPLNAKELENEGKKLHHCVASYKEKIVKGDSEIYFLRKKEHPDDPFFTIEVEPKFQRVIQVRTDHNKVDESITNLVKEFFQNKTKEVLQ